MTNAAKVFGIVGWKNSGKTTLLTGLIREFASEGLSVSTVKHSHHLIEMHDVTANGNTDSARHLKAGAKETALVTPDGTFILGPAPTMFPSSDLVSALALLSPCDLILVEGFKHEGIASIECRHTPTDRPLVLANIVAIATDSAHDDGTLPRFARHDIEAIAEFIKTFHSL